VASTPAKSEPRGVERFVVTLEPTGAGAPPELRLRALLKSALRVHGLRAVRVEAIEQERRA